jgi:DnaK suppressor protein
MDQDVLEYFHNLLLEQKRDVLARANQTVIREANSVAEPLADYADLATVESDRNFDLRIHDRERKLLKKINQALERIDEGTFGLCERCGEDISCERLKARPVATYCIECKTKLEQQELE